MNSERKKTTRIQKNVCQKCPGRDIHNKSPVAMTQPVDFKLMCINVQRSDISCSWPLGLHTSGGVVTHSALQILYNSLMFTFWQLVPLVAQVFYGIKIWRLTRPLQDLNMLLFEPNICWPCVLGNFHAGIAAIQSASSTTRSKIRFSVLPKDTANDLGHRGWDFG